MINLEALRQTALSLPGVTEAPHFEKTSFRVNKKIFATMAAGSTIATVMLSTADQDIFCTFDNTVIYPVPNKWGQKGATHINLLKVREDMLTDLLKTAYRKAAPRELAEKVTFDE